MPTRVNNDTHPTHLDIPGSGKPRQSLRDPAVHHPVGPHSNSPAVRLSPVLPPSPIEAASQRKSSIKGPLHLGMVPDRRTAIRDASHMGGGETEQLAQDMDDSLVDASNMSISQRQQQRGQPQRPESPNIPANYFSPGSPLPTSRVSVVAAAATDQSSQRLPSPPDESVNDVTDVSAVGDTSAVSAATATVADMAAWREVPAIVRETLKQMLLSFSETSTTVARHTALLGAGEKQEQLHNARLQALESQVASLTDELATSREQEQAAQRAMAALENEVAESRGLAQTVATQTAEAIARELDMMRSTVVAAAENRARQVVQDLRDNLSETRRLVHEARAAAVATAVSQVGPKVDEATADAIARLRAPLQAELREYADSAVATTIALVTATADAATANATSGATRLSGHGTNPTILADEHILALVRREVPQMLDERMDQTKKVMDAKWAEGDAKTKHLVRQTEGEILEMVRAMAKVIDKQHSHDQALQGIRADLERAVAEQQERTDAVSSRCDQLEATLSGQQRAHIASPALEQNKNEPPALSRLDVELLLEARDDAIHSQSKATARHINELDGVVQDIAKAVSEMHAAMVDRHMLGGLKAQLQSTQQAIGECRSWAEHAIRDVVLEMASAGTRVGAEHDRLDKLVAGHTISLSDLRMAQQTALDHHISDVSSQLQSLVGVLESKVDCEQVATLARAVATRQDMKKYVDKKLRSIGGGTAALERIAAVEVQVGTIQQAGTQRSADIETAAGRAAHALSRTEAVEQQLARMDSVIKDEVRAAAAATLRKRIRDDPLPYGATAAAASTGKAGGDYIVGGNGGGLHPDDFAILQHKLAAAMDEKLFMVASEVAMLRAQYATVSAHPQLRCGVWLWKSGSLKHGSGIPWSLEAQNTDAENLRWEPDACVVRVREPGVYELSFCFFTRLKPSIQVVVNGESVMSAIHAPTYTVHHGSGFVADGDGRMREGAATGISLRDFVALPAKSTICLHWHGKLDQTVEGFMSLKRIN